MNKLMNNSFLNNKILIYFLVTLILSIIFWKWWEFEPRVANDFPLIQKSVMESFFNLPQVWTERGSEGLGQYTIFTLWSWPMVLISGILAKIGFEFWLIQKIIFFIPFLLIRIWSIQKNGNQLLISKWAMFISTLFYLTGTYPILLMDGGQLSIGLAYSLFPLCFFKFNQSISGSWRERAIAGFLIFGLGFLDIRFVYLLVLLCLIRFLYEFLFLRFDEWKFWIVKWLKSALIIGFIFLGLNAYWLLTLIKAPISGNLYNFITQTTLESFLNLGHSFLAISPNWHTNVYGNTTPLLFGFGLIPVLVFIAPVLRMKDKLVGFWLIVAMIAIFLTKGSAEPFPEIYNWFFNNIPGFSLFRDSTKFFFLLMLSYSILIGISIDEILRRINKSPILKISFLVGLIAYFIILIRPVWSGEMTGTLSTPRFEREYQDLQNTLSQDRKFGRIFWIPTTFPLSYSDLLHPITEAGRLVERRPFALGTVGTYELFNFINQSEHIGDIFDIAGIKYIVYPYPDPQKINLKSDEKEYYNYFLNSLSNLSWTESISTGSAVPLIKTKSHQDHFFIASNLYWVIGSDSIYKEIKLIPGFKLATNALIFAEENPNLQSRLDNTHSKIILFNKNEFDLAVYLLGQDKLFFPAKNLGNKPNDVGWWKRNTSDFIWWRDFLEQKYGLANTDFDLGGGWAVAEGEKRLISDKSFTSGDILLARVMESARGGTIIFNQDKQQIGKINTKLTDSLEINRIYKGKNPWEFKNYLYSQANFRWVEVGVVGNASLEIITSGDINVINAMTVINPQEWQEAKTKAGILVSQDKVINWEKLTQNEKKQLFTVTPQARVSYQTISPSHYKVRIQDVKKPIILAFSETYDQNWKINGLIESFKSQQALPLYSLINGFEITRDGEYDIYFMPQRYILPGLIISGVTLLISLTFLIFFKDRKS